jgi:hypothetical protein
MTHAIVGWLVPFCLGMAIGTYSVNLERHWKRGDRTSMAYAGACIAVQASTLAIFTFTG